MTSIIKVEGIGKVYTEKLREAGISTVEALLKQCSAEKGRHELAAKGGIDPDLILRWANHADLFRIKGIGEEYSQLLEAAGVDTVPELAQRVPANLLAKLTEINQKKELVRRLPVLSQVEGWVAQAKQLPRIITY
jgi:predicted flap endonuclease-1-like 5' DNA nuclease